MAIYKNITSGATTTLISKVNTRNFPNKVNGIIRKITISNNGPNPATIRLYLHDGDSATYYICKDMIIPSAAILVLEDNLSFDVNIFHLKLELNNQYGTEDLTVTIK